MSNQFDWQQSERDWRAKTARNQTEIVDALKDQRFIRDETYTDLQVCKYGFSNPDGSPLPPDVLHVAIRNLFTFRPSQRTLEVIPVDVVGSEDALPVSEISLFSQSPLVYRMTFKEKADAITNRMAIDPSIVGFKVNLHGLDIATNRPTADGVAITGSISLLRLKNPVDQGKIVPVKVRVVYRADF